MKQEHTVKYWANLSLCLFGASFLLWLAFRYLLGILIPFVIGWAAALLTRPLAYRIHKGTRIPLRFLRLATLLSILLLLGLFVWGIARRLILEGQELIARFEENGFPSLSSLLEKLPPPLLRLWESLSPDKNGAISKILSHLMDGIFSFVPRLVSGVVGALPGLILSLVITVVAGVYFCLDLENIHRVILSYVPKGYHAGVLRLKGGLVKTGFLYLRSYLILMGITFALLTLGFLVIKVKYAILLALLVSFVDFLPVFGVGTVLVPWSIFCFLFGSPGRGLGLLVLYGISLILRQYLEPKILGGSLGIHPLLTLIFLYGGFYAGGIGGMLIAPLVGVMLLSFLPKKEVEGKTG